MKEKLEEYIEKGLVMVNKHPFADLYIYNYTQKVQYEKLWDEITLLCRGLILDGKGNIVAHPFAKFFNYEEHIAMEGFEFPTCNFRIQDKMDGSLGISYRIGDEIFIATRGSFVSEQALWATEYLKTHHADAMQRMEKECTYLFEIIYPDNRIVVDYMGESSLTHLCTTVTKTGRELFPESIGIPFVETYGEQSSADEIVRVHDLMNRIDYDNKEGVVVTFENGFKCKMKHPEYVRLHRIMTNISKKNVWEMLRDGFDIEDMIKDTPDEFYKEINAYVEDFVDQFNDIKDSYALVYEGIKRTTVYSTRKEWAMRFQEYDHPAILFRMKDCKSVDELIWKIIKPKSK